MPRRLIDISTTLRTGILSDPPQMLPEIDYIAHQQGALEMAAAFPGLTPDQLPNGEGWAVERVRISTHNGTHLDAPWHYASTMNNGQRAITIDEVPLEIRADDGHEVPRICPTEAPMHPLPPHGTIPRCLNSSTTSGQMALAWAMSSSAALDCCVRSLSIPRP